MNKMIQERQGGNENCNFAPEIHELEDNNQHWAQITRLNHVIKNKAKRYIE
jgi:hypothetical protein